LGYRTPEAFRPRSRRGIGGASHFLRQGRSETTSCSLNTQRIGFFTDGVSGLGPDHRCMNWNLLDIDVEAA